MNKFSIGLDLMRTADLGVHAHFGGSALLNLFVDSGMVGTVEQKENELWTFIQKSYTEHKSPHEDDASAEILVV